MTEPVPRPGQAAQLEFVERNGYLAQLRRQYGVDTTMFTDWWVHCALTERDPSRFNDPAGLDEKELAMLLRWQQFQLLLVSWGEPEQFHAECGITVDQWVNAIGHENRALVKLTAAESCRLRRMADGKRGSTGRPTEPEYWRKMKQHDDLSRVERHQFVCEAFPNWLTYNDQPPLIATVNKYHGKVRQWALQQGKK